MSKFKSAFFVTISIICFQDVQAQDDFKLWTSLLFGELNLEVSQTRFNGRKAGLITSEKMVIVIKERDSLGGLGGYLTSYTAPAETKIVSATFKADNDSIVLILLSDGKVQIVRHDWYTGKWNHEEPIKPDINFSGAKKIVGDALYILKNGVVFASWDTAKTWSIDSINIGKFNTTDISIDTNYYGWISTNQGIFYQHPDSNIWHISSPLPGTSQSASAIFVDRRNRIFVSRPGKVFVSTDRGSSWEDISSGAIQTITSFGDDAFGNVYAVGSGSHAYRLSNLTPPWISIADSINAQAYLLSSAKIVNSIGGDTILFAATIYGMFHSTDFGANWIHSSNTVQSKSHRFYAGVVKAANYYFISNSLGIYRISEGDSTVEKVFPKKGFIYGVNALKSDSAGNVYGNLPIKTGSSAYLFYTVKSTDHGDTWIPDTAGFKALGINSGTQSFDFFVDRQGTQYLGGSGVLYSKKPGQLWKRDTTGIGMKSGEYIADVSQNNKKGIIYLCRRVGTFPTYSIGIYRRSIGDSVWQVVKTDTLAASEGRLISDHEGNIVVRTLSQPYKLWRYDGSTWKEIPLPTNIGSSPFINPMTVDNDGVIWGVFFAGGFNKGVYFTANNGTDWKYVGLDKVGIPYLSAVEESTTTLKKSAGGLSSAVYATSFIDGIHRFTTASEPTTVENEKPEIAQSYELYQNYPNPFNPTTTISFSVPVQSLVTLKVYDILGREVMILLNEERKEGTHSVLFDASKLSTGVYLYNLRAGSYISTKKLLLMK